MPDLSTYLARIHSPEDKPLFEEAANCASAGSLRAAYVMVWLACAESLKRRFREAQRRDGAAGIIVGNFEQKERDQKAIDKYLLEKAKDYGFFSDAAHLQLQHVYEMRCVYGHPYESAPTNEQVVHAASVAVDHLLSHPVRLKHGFVQSLLQSLLADKAFLDDTREAVKLFADEILRRIDDSVLAWMLDKYWADLEKIARDASQLTLLKRGVWFTREVLSVHGPDLLSPDQWHAKAGAYPETLIRLIRAGDLFCGIGPLAQDSLIGKVIEFSQAGRPSLLQCFEPLLVGGSLSERQAERLREHINALDVKLLSSCGLNTATCFPRIITALQSRTWPVQNPAIRFIASNGPDQASELNREQLIELGRNILQAAEGSAGSAASFLSDLKSDNAAWPADLLRGIAYECFTNEADQIRFKKEHLGTALSILDSRGEQFAKEVCNEIEASIQRGTLKHEWIRRARFDEATTILQGHAWASGVVDAVNEVASRLPEEDANG